MIEKKKKKNTKDIYKTMNSNNLSLEQLMKHQQAFFWPTENAINKLNKITILFPDRYGPKHLVADGWGLFAPVTKKT